MYYVRVPCAIVPRRRVIGGSVLGPWYGSGQVMRPERTDSKCTRAARRVPKMSGGGPRTRGPLGAACAPAGVLRQVMVSGESIVAAGCGMARLPGGRLWSRTPSAAQWTRPRLKRNEVHVLLSAVALPVIRTRIGPTTSFQKPNCSAPILPECCPRVTCAPKWRTENVRAYVRTCLVVTVTSRN